MSTAKWKGPSRERFRHFGDQLANHSHHKPDQSGPGERRDSSNNRDDAGAGKAYTPQTNLIGHRGSPPRFKR